MIEKTTKIQALNNLARHGKKFTLLTGIALLTMTASKAAAGEKKRADKHKAEKTIRFDTIRSNIDAISFYQDSIKKVSIKYVNEPETSGKGLIKSADYNGIFYRAYPGTVNRGKDGRYQINTHCVWDKYINLAIQAGILSKTDNADTSQVVSIQTNGAFTVAKICSGKDPIASFLYDEHQKRFLILFDNDTKSIDLLPGENARGGYSVQIRTTPPLISTDVCGRKMHRDDVIIDFDSHGKNAAPRNENDKNIPEINTLLNDIIVERIMEKNAPKPFKRSYGRNSKVR